ncbi:MAG: SDR family oxidoreductase [Candidatus Melainabacteria bacterium]|nr:SDR family oxidoreductase [Candidatus Melainabacteria bacterium]
MVPKKIAVVTGANRGIGFEITRQLAKKDIQVILTSRNKTKGLIAVQKLHEEEGLEVVFHQLDVTDSISIQALIDFIKKEYERLDILVNNAGIMLDKNDSENASILKTKLDTIRKTMETNTYGPLAICQAFIPLMKKNNYGRIVNISSGMGQLEEMNGNYPGYRLSKVSLNALTKIFADELKEHDILINSMCPGWVRTDMGGPNATRSIEEGAETAVWLATLPSNSPSGGFFRDRNLIPW